MQKHFLIFLFLLGVTTTFAQKAVQHSAYVGIEIPYLTMNYDARFRNPDSKVDFAVGGGLAMSPSLGFAARGSLLFGKNANALELGLSVFYSNHEYSLYNSRSVEKYLGRQSVTEFRPFIGYRLQPKNKHFILQIQYLPLIFIMRTDFNTYRNTTITTPTIAIPAVTSYYPGGGGGFGTALLPHLSLHLGCSINTIKKDDTENATYEAPENEKISLEHTAATFLRLGNVYDAYGLLYDLRLRRSKGVDFALNLSFAYGSFYFRNKISQSSEILVLMFKNKVNLEAGIGVHSVINPSSSYSSISQSIGIGVPLGFRYQARRHVFVRSYVMPFKAFSDDGKGNFSSNLYSYPLLGFIDGATWALNLGYTF